MTIRRRLRKQLTIVGIAGGAGLLVGVSLWAILREPPPPAPPPAPVFAPLTVLSAQLLRSGAGAADLLAIVKNPNAGAGVRRVPYTFHVSGAGDETTVTGETFFLPGQEKPLVLVGRPVPSGANQVTLTLGDPDWVVVGADFRAPRLLTVSRTAVVRERGPPVYELKAVLANESDLDFRTVDVTVLGLTADGEVVGVGRTLVGELLARERREFTVSWPLPAGATVSDLRISPEVNVFLPTSLLPRPGVPGLEPGPRSLRSSPSS